MIVLDSSALLAVLLDEPAAAGILPRLSGALMSTVNLAETLGRMGAEGLDPAEYAVEIAGLGVIATPVSEAHALDAARLRPTTRHLGLSLGDRLCLALARERNLPVLTMDRQWLRHDFGVPVERPG